jgi:hypothetical protein
MDKCQRCHCRVANPSGDCCNNKDVFNKAGDKEQLKKGRIYIPVIRLALKYCPFTEDTVGAKSWNTSIERKW